MTVTLGAEVITTRQKTTVFNAFVFCQFFNEINCRTIKVCAPVKLPLLCLSPHESNLMHLPQHGADSYCVLQEFNVFSKPHLTTTHELIELQVHVIGYVAMKPQQISLFVQMKYEKEHHSKLD